MLIRFFVPVLLFFPVWLLGQSVDSLEQSTRRQRRAATAQAVQHLQESGLIVRIPTNSRQLKALDDLLADDQLSKRRRNSIQERRDQLAREADSTGQFLVEQFRRYYHLGPLYFVYDSTDLEASRARQNPIFLNEEMELDPQINGPATMYQANTPTYLVLRIAPLQGYARNEGFVISDVAGDQPPKPFPAVTGFDSKFFLTKKNKRNARNAQLESAVFRLVQQLNRIVVDFGN